MKESHSVVLVVSGQTAGAIDEMRRTLASLEKVHGPVHMDVAIAMQNLGSALVKDGQIAEAEVWSLRALELTKRLFGDESANTAQALVNYGEVLTELHRLDEARLRESSRAGNLSQAERQRLLHRVRAAGSGPVQLAAGDPKNRPRGDALLAAGRTLGKAHPLLSAEIDFAIRSGILGRARRSGRRLAARAAGPRIDRGDERTRAQGCRDGRLARPLHGGGSGGPRELSECARPYKNRHRVELETSAMGGPGDGRCRCGRLLRL